MLQQLASVVAAAAGKSSRFTLLISGGSSRAHQFHRQLNSSSTVALLSSKQQQLLLCPPPRRHLFSSSSSSPLFFLWSPSSSSTSLRRAFLVSSSSSSPFSTTTTEAAMPPITPTTTADVNSLIASERVVIFSKDGCPYCERVKALLDGENVLYLEVKIDTSSEGEGGNSSSKKVREELAAKVGRTSLPQVFVDGQHLGGCDDTLAKHEEGVLLKLIRGHPFQYDLIVIGGGSGGLAASKEAAALGRKVALLDFVTPTPQGTTWGLGGTCVNVGCIPKKLMHTASLLGADIEDAQFFGWQTAEGKPVSEGMKHDWATLVANVQNNIKSSNFGYRNALRDGKVKYINARGSLVDAHTIKLTHKNGKEETLSSNHFLVATGERPKYPEEVEGAREHSITSDDLFSLPYRPGPKTLVVGASYVALECAGFLQGIGVDVTVMVRSIVLRGFDRQCSELVRDYMEKTEKIRFIDSSVPKKIVRLEEEGKSEEAPGTVAVTYTNTATGAETTETFNTVLFAVGRAPCTAGIGLEAAGVEKDAAGYLPAVAEQTNVPNIYAVGDILQGRPQLTPVAIQAGVLLARRLYARSTVQCDYLNVPTTVFTPLEYGCCGHTEEGAAQAMGGPEKIEVYHQFFAPTEWRLNYYDRPRKPLNVCYVKVIVTRSKNGDPKEERLLGFHYVGPNAGEVTQMVGLPLKMGATKADLDGLIGIHPTNAEIFTTLTVTKRSGLDPTQKGCCG